MSSLAIFGNTPALSALELQRLYPDTHWTNGSVATLEQTPDLKILGGTVKIAKQLGNIPRSLAGVELVKKYLQERLHPGTKFRFGFSVYAGDATITPTIVKHYTKKLHPLGIQWKKDLKQADQPIRLVESLEPALSSVIVKKEHLLDQQTDIIFAIYHDKIVLGATAAVQDYEDYAARDFGRPGRDHFSGMLPPKVARMMVNIAQPKPSDMILDPFCGSGTIVQEALLLGYTHVQGSDISKKSIADTQANLAWLKLPSIPVHLSDVVQLSSMLPPHSIDCIVAEGYLGPAYPHKTDKTHRQLTRFYQEVLAMLPTLLRPHARVVVALPAWRKYDGMLTLELDRTIKQAEFTPFHSPVFYGRPDAKVVRQIFFLTL